MHQFPIGQIPPRRGHLLYKCGPKNNALYSKVPRLLLRENFKFRIFIACFFKFLLQLFDRRSKFVCSNERELWGQLNAVYMSDEETDTENEGFITHREAGC